MADTALRRIPREELSPEWQGAWDMLNGLTGEPTFIEAMANAPELLNFAMVEFYQKIFFGGRVEQKYKQLLRLRLSLAHCCRSCNLQNRTGIATRRSPRSKATARCSMQPSGRSWISATR
jgi:hypothetical protein